MVTKQKYPEPTVGALIFDSTGRISLMKFHKWKNRYVMPGGHIELGEEIEGALKREIKEETGWTTTIASLFVFKNLSMIALFGKRNTLSSWTMPVKRIQKK